MKIEEVVGLYSLVANIGWLGILGIILFIVAFVLYSLHLIETKLKKPVNRYVVVVIGGFFVGSILFLKFDSISKQSNISLANHVKSEFIVNGFKSMSYKMIWEFNPMLEEKFDREVIEKLPNIFPTEFAFTVVNGLDSLDTLGLQLIDPVALSKIDNFNLVNLSLIKATIKDYMVRKKINTLSYHQIRDSIDLFFDDEWIELMISKYDSVFIPINQIGDNPSPRSIWFGYSDSHMIRLKK